MLSTSSELPRRLALVDVNNFYASCEALFDPKLRRRPLVVLSNSDGCVISRSAEAKALGIKMAQPWHQIRKQAEAQGVIAMSSNYTLYADLSSRVMNTLEAMAPTQEVYSIDECFLDLTGARGLRGHGLHIRARVQQWIGLTVCVGIGSTKTRAKLANHIAKKFPEFRGVCDVESFSADEQDQWFTRLPVEEVWGIGGKHAARLRGLGISTVKGLRDCDVLRLRDSFNVVLARTVEELRGISCLDMKLLAPDKKQIMSSRSFGRSVTSLAELREAAVTYVSRAAEKLREQESLAGMLHVFVKTNIFKPDAPQYSGVLNVKLPFATDDTILLARFAAEAINQLYRPGFEYKKAGTMLMDLQPKAQRQITLFDDPRRIERRDNLNQAMDRINSRFGRGSVSVAAAGIDNGWRMQRAKLSPRYTTCIDELPMVSSNRSDSKG